MPRDNGRLKTGQIINTNNLPDFSRRKYLKSLGIAGGGLVGIKQAIEVATGKSPEGVPLVMTTDARGNPDRVRMVSKERYRRLKVFEKLPIKKFINKHPIVNQVRLTGTKQGELELLLEIDPVNEQKKNKLPNRYSRIPISTVERSGHHEPDINSTGHCSEDDNDSGCSSHRKTQEPLMGALGVSGNSTKYIGTLGLVGYRNGNPTLVTARHVVTDSNGNNISQDISQGSQTVGTLVSESDSDDIAAYELQSGIGYDAREIHDNFLTIEGKWTYSGLSDYFVWNSYLHSQFCGATSCFDQDDAWGVSRNEEVSHQVNFRQNKANGGDSGAPWVDDDNKLIGIHHGNYVADECDDCASVADQALDSVGVTLY